MRLAAVVVFSSVWAFAADIDTVEERLRESQLPSSKEAGAGLADAVSTYLGTFIPSNCTYTGIDYNSDRRAGWPVMGHLSRTQTILAGWRSNFTGPAIHNNETVRAIGVCALNWWLVVKPKCPNWYDQEIAGPNNIGQAVLYLGPGSLPENQTKAANELINLAQWPGWTGSNLLFMLRA